MLEREAADKNGSLFFFTIPTGLAYIGVCH